MSDSEEEITEKQLKVVFLGDANVGKTSLIRRFCYDEFSRPYNSTIGADFYIKRLYLPNRSEIKIRISDVGGMELKGHMLPNYLFQANIIFLVYDITSSNSFESLPVWINSISKVIENQTPCVLLGNKCDLEHKRAVRLDTTQKFIKETKILGYLMSAKTGEAVNACLTDLVARHFGITLSRVEREKQAPIIRAELIPETPVVISQTNRKNAVKRQKNAAACVLQ